MDKNSSPFERPFYFSVLKGLGIGVFALILKSIVSFATWQRYATDSIFGYLENYQIYIVSFIASLFVYNSVIGISMSYDVFAKDEVMERTFDSKGGMPSLKGIYGYKNFLIESLTLSAVLFFAALLGASPEIFGMFHFEEGTSPYSSGLYPALVTLPIVLFLSLYARFEAVRYWKFLYRTAKTELIESKTRLLLRVIFITVLYPIVLPFMPALAYVFITLASAVAAVALAMTIPVFIITILCLILVLWLIKLLFAIRRRNKFITRMKDAAEKMKFTVSEIKNPRISFLSGKKKCIFTLVRGEEKYDCLIIGHPRYHVPVCFCSESEGYYRHRIGTPRHNITLQSKFDYKIEGDGKKILIIAPTPKHAFIIDGDKEKRLFTADKLWSAVIYEADGFIGALERDCLGRYAS